MSEVWTPPGHEDVENMTYIMTGKKTTNMLTAKGNQGAFSRDWDRRQ